MRNEYLSDMLKLYDEIINEFTNMTQSKGFSKNKAQLELQNKLEKPLKTIQCAVRVKENKYPEIYFVFKKIFAEKFNEYVDAMKEDIKKSNKILYDIAEELNISRAYAQELGMLYGFSLAVEYTVPVKKIGLFTKIFNLFKRNK